MPISLSLSLSLRIVSFFFLGTPLCCLHFLGFCSLLLCPYYFFTKNHCMWQDVDLPRSLDLRLDYFSSSFFFSFSFFFGGIVFFSHTFIIWTFLLLCKRVCKYYVSSCVVWLPITVMKILIILLESFDIKFKFLTPGWGCSSSLSPLQACGKFTSNQFVFTRQKVLVD